MQALTSSGHLGLGVGRQHHEGVFDPPVGRVGHVRDARQAVELDVVLGRVAAQRPRGACGAGRPRRGTRRRRRSTACEARPEQLAHQRRRAARSASGRAALLDLAQPVVQRLDQLAAAARDCPAGRPAGRGCAAPPRCRPAPRTACAPSGRCGARRAGGCSSVPAAVAEQADHDLAVGEARCSCRGSRAVARARRPATTTRSTRSEHSSGWGLGWALRAHEPGPMILSQAPRHCRRAQNNTRLRMVPGTCASFSSARSE